ncbi:MAG: hypothetical protein Q8R66_12610 [Methanobacteriaceae archaeon]|nr:hypothetical protein [Methanobacteriaceae archaeon]
MIKHYEGIIKKAPYKNKKDSIFIDHNPKPIINTIKEEISIYGPLIRLQVLTTASLESPMYFFKQEKFEPYNLDGYVELLKPLKDYEGQNCKILLEFQDID